MPLLVKLSDTGIFSLSWWITTVVAAFLVNIASAYAKPRLDALLAERSGARRAAAQEASTKRRARVARLRSSNHAQLLESFAIQAYRLKSLGTGGVGLFVILYTSWVSITHQNSTVQRIIDYLIRLAIFVLITAALTYRNMARKLERDLNDALQDDLETPDRAAA
jgi:hypothetical protein